MAEKHSSRAPVTASRAGYTGLSLADSFQGLRQTVSGGSWVEGALAGGAFGAEVAATVLDPFSALLSNGLSWAMEYFEPLREILDKLAGIPDVVSANARTWANVAAELGSIADDL